MAFIVGTPGADALFDTAGDDTVLGGYGNDTLTAAAIGGGFDRLYGGDGVDTLVLDASGSAAGFRFTAEDAIPGYQDYDGVGGILRVGAQGIGFYGVERLVLTTSDAGALVTLDAFTSGSKVTTGAGADTIYGGGPDTLSAGEGDDVVSALHTGAVVDLGGGRNILSLDRADATAGLSIDIPGGTYDVPGLSGVLAGLGEFRSGSGDDRIIGDGQGAIYGGAGDDTLGGGQSLFGGEGIDTLKLDFAAATGDIQLGASAPGATTWLGFEFALIDTGSKNDRVDLSGAGYRAHVATHDGADFVRGGAGADTIDAGAGDDLVEALGLGSVVDLGTGLNGLALDRSDATTALRLDVSTGLRDVPGLSGAVGYLTAFYAGSGNDSISNRDAGSSASLYGGAGSDTLVGGSGDYTVLDGGSGADRLVGGAGYTVYYVDSARDVVAHNPTAGGEIHTTLSAYKVPAGVTKLVYEGTGTFAGSGSAGAEHPFRPAVDGDDPARRGRERHSAGGRRRR